MVSGKLVYGKWTDREAAAGDYLRMRDLARQSADGPMATLEQGMQSVLSLVTKDGTIRSYKEHFRTLITFFGNVPLHEITPARIEAFRDHRRAQRHRGKPITDLRINKDLARLNHIFRLAVQQGHFPGQNPCSRVRLAKVPVKEAHFYDVVEIGVILQSIRRLKLPTATRFHDVLALLFFSGVRKSELARLRAADVDRKAGRLSIVGKTGPRTIPICRPMMTVLDRLMEDADSDGHLVHKGMPSKSKRPKHGARSDEQRRIDWIGNSIHRYRGHLEDLWANDRAKLDKRAAAEATHTHQRLLLRLHPHSFRHAIKTYLAERDVAPFKSDAYSGHSRSRRNAASRYEHATFANLRQMVADHLDPLAHLIEDESAGAATSAAAGGA